MPKRPAPQRLRFPRSDHVIISVADHALLTDLIGPYYSRDLEGFLAHAANVPDGRGLNHHDPIIEALLEAIAGEIHGFMKLDDERDHQPRVTPKRNSTAQRLLAIHRQIEQYLS